MTNEELEQVYDCLDGGFGETSGKLSAHIKALEAENERLKGENIMLRSAGLKQTLEHEQIFKDFIKENKRLKCLALHLFEKVAKNEASEWSEFCDDSFPHSGIHKCKRRKEQWLRIVKKCGDEYRKAKAELMKSKCK